MTKPPTYDNSPERIGRLRALLEVAEQENARLEQLVLSLRRQLAQAKGANHEGPRETRQDFPGW